jgi:hypothetical protein
MWTHAEAEKIVRDLIVAATEYTKAVNTTGRCKGAASRERKAAAVALAALMGEKPTAEQLDRVCIF